MPRKNRCKPNALLSFFSPDTNRYYKLFETSTWPGLEFSGIKMHLVKNTDPRTSSYTMVSYLKPVRGFVLDTCACLGYTSIVLASHPTVEKVFTFEIDSNVIEIAKQNLASQSLFSNPKIVFRHESILSGIESFPDNYFDCILHDPPSIKIAGELYSSKFYQQLYRVLKSSGKLYHYTGTPGLKRGINIQESVLRRLHEIGFIGLVKTKEVAGVIAHKPAQ